MSEISPVYDSTMKKQRQGPHRPWHTNQAPQKTRTDAPKSLARYDKAGLLALPQIELGIRVEPPKPRNSSETYFEPHPRWWDILRCIQGASIMVPITLAVEGGADKPDSEGRSLNDKISHSRQANMFVGNAVPAKSPFLAKLEADITALKARSKAADRGDVGGSPFAEPPQPRIWKR